MAAAGMAAAAGVAAGRAAGLSPAEQGLGSLNLNFKPQNPKQGGKPC